MLPNTPRDISDSVAITPVKPEALKEQLYAALEQQGYSRSNKPRTPGYYDCVRKDSIEISGVIFPQRKDLRVDVSLLVNIPGNKNFGETNCGGLYFLTPRELIYATGDNLQEILDKLADIAEKGRRIADENPDKSVV